MGERDDRSGMASVTMGAAHLKVNVEQGNQLRQAVVIKSTDSWAEWRDGYKLSEDTRSGAQEEVGLLNASPLRSPKGYTAVDTGLTYVNYKGSNVAEAVGEGKYEVINVGVEGGISGYACDATDGEVASLVYEVKCAVDVINATTGSSFSVMVEPDGTRLGDKYKKLFVIMVDAPAVEFALMLSGLEAAGYGSTKFFKSEGGRILVQHGARRRGVWADLPIVCKASVVVIGMEASAYGYESDVAVTVLNEALGGVNILSVQPLREFENGIRVLLEFSAEKAVSVRDKIFEFSK